MTTAISAASSASPGASTALAALTRAPTAASRWQPQDAAASSGGDHASYPDQMGSLRRGPDAVRAVPLVDLGPTSARSPRLASGLIDNGGYVPHRFATFGSPSVSGHEIRFANWTAAPGKVGIASEAITTSAVETSDRSTAARAGIAQTRGAPDLAAAADDFQHCDGAVARAVLLGRRCSSELIGALPGSAGPANEVVLAQPSTAPGCKRFGRCRNGTKRGRVARSPARRRQACCLSSEAGARSAR